MQACKLCGAKKLVKNGARGGVQRFLFGDCGHKFYDNSIIEKAHGTLKDRLRPARGLKNDWGAKTWLDGYFIKYNFCRTHQSIGMTPAQAVGVEVKGWKQLIEKAQMQRTVHEMKVELAAIEVTS